MTCKAHRFLLGVFVSLSDTKKIVESLEEKNSAELLSSRHIGSLSVVNSKGVSMVMLIIIIKYVGVAEK